MYDDLHAPDGAHDDLGYQPSRPAPVPLDGRAAPAPDRPAPDREVPLPAGGDPDLLHRWLDGEVPTGVMRATQGGNETVDLWNKIHDEAETLRSRTTPLYVHKRIMDALPDDAYRTQRPWYRRTVELSPAGLIAAAAALLALGGAIAHAVLR